MTTQGRPLGRGLSHQVLSTPLLAAFVLNTKMVTAATGQGPWTYTSASFCYLYIAQMVQAYFWPFLLSLISGMAMWGQEHPPASSRNLFLLYAVKLLFTCILHDVRMTRRLSFYRFSTVCLEKKGTQPRAEARFTIQSQAPTHSYTNQILCFTEPIVLTNGIDEC